MNRTIPVKHGVFRDPISAKLISQPRPADPVSMGKLDPLVVKKCEHGQKPKKCKDCASREETK